MMSTRCLLLLLAAEPGHPQLEAQAESLAAEPRELFTLRVDNAHAPDGLPVPLVVREGDNAEVLATLFAARYRLDDATRAELALAIVEHSKSLGFVRPLFVLEANVSNTKVPLNVYKGDVPRGTAALFAQTYNLTEDAQTLIERVIATKAKAAGHIHPLLSLTVTLEQGDPPKTADLNVFEGDVVADVVTIFAETHGLSELALVKLQRALLNQLKAHNLAEPVLELNVELGEAKGGSVPLALYEGEVLEHVAAEFGALHDLSHTETEAVVLLLEEQLTKKGLLPPLLFKLPVVLPSDRVVQLGVHDGDEPHALAASFVQRHAAEIWPAMDSTREDLTVTISEHLASYRSMPVAAVPVDKQAPDVVTESPASVAAAAAAAAMAAASASP